jgi:ferric-dicitrate binding protein FerR (iron transport regulator)
VLGIALTSAAAWALFVFASREDRRIEWLDTPLDCVRVGGVTASGELLEARILAGGVLESQATSMRLRIDESVLIELAPETLMSLEDWSENGGRQGVVRLVRGGVRILTGPGFAPRGLRVVAPDAQVSVVGTEFGVDVFEGTGTCVCCTQGTVSVQPRSSARADTVRAGGMSFCFSSGEPPMLDVAKEDHAAQITALRRYGFGSSAR